MMFPKLLKRIFFRTYTSVNDLAWHTVCEVQVRVTFLIMKHVLRWDPVTSYIDIIELKNITQKCKQKSSGWPVRMIDRHHVKFETSNTFLLLNNFEDFIRRIGLAVKTVINFSWKMITLNRFMCESFQFLFLFSSVLFECKNDSRHSMRSK